MSEFRRTVLHDRPLTKVGQDPLTRAVSSALDQMLAKDRVNAALIENDLEQVDGGVTQ